MMQKINEAVAYLQKQGVGNPKIGIVLGTGLGGMVKNVVISHDIHYRDIPHFPESTVESHSGKLIFGSMNGKQVVVMNGRFHFYEGYTMQQIVFPVRVLQANGAKTLIVSNAAGGMNPLFKKGDVMCISDHINLIGDNPLMGPNDDLLGPRFPDMSQPYSYELMDRAEKVALENGIRMQHGVYVAVSGPNLETKAEYRFLRNLGADVVGMSTVPETIAAVHMGMSVLGFSVITDECFPDALEPVQMADILAAADIAQPKMTKLIVGVLESL